MGSLSLAHSVRDRLSDTLSAHTNELLAVFSRFIKQGKGMLQPHQLLAEYKAVIPEADCEKLKDGVFEDVPKAAQEAIVLPPWVALAIRPRPGVWEFVRVNVSELAVEELSVPEYLQFKEELADGRWALQFEGIYTELFYCNQVLTISEFCTLLHSAVLKTVV